MQVQAISSTSCLRDSEQTSSAEHGKTSRIALDVHARLKQNLFAHPDARAERRLAVAVVALRRVPGNLLDVVLAVQRAEVQRGAVRRARRAAPRRGVVAHRRRPGCARHELGHGCGVAALWERRAGAVLARGAERRARAVVGVVTDGVAGRGVGCSGGGGGEEEEDAECAKGHFSGVQWGHIYCLY